MAEQKKDKKVTFIEKLKGFGKKISKFFKEIRSELKKVVWPSKKQLVNNTTTVIVACLLIGVIIWVSDLVFQLLYSIIFA